MEIQLVSHSSVLLRCSDLTLYADPWLRGKVFNESWTLHPKPHFDESELDDVDYVWISHEHPDHFNIPTLRNLPESFKHRVRVLFQKNNSNKVFDALQGMGFKSFLALPHREVVRISPVTEVYCYQVGQMDSCLGVRNAGQVVYNTNDATVSRADAETMIRDFGRADVVLNQFSTAGYAGYADHAERLRGMAREHLDLLVRNHRDLEAGVTIPFASFVYYSCTDNRYLNDFANRPADVAARFEQEGLPLAVLYPGDLFEVGGQHDSTRALERFADAYAAMGELEFDAPAPVPLSEIKTAFEEMSRGLRARYPMLVLRRLGALTVRIPDLGTSVRFELSSGTFEEIDGVDTDLTIHAQPLKFMFQTPYGLQTLGVSGRCVVRGNESSWTRHRILLSMYNAEIYLKPSLFFSTSNLRFLMARRHGLARQLRTRLAHMRMGF